MKIMKIEKLKFTELDKMKAPILAKINLFKNKKVLVVGDIGIDEYIKGLVKRISPEAPVPVLNVVKKENCLGLAANVAKNISNLGAECCLISVTGDDKNKESIEKLCEKNNIKFNFISDGSRPTTIKTRVIHEAHHIAVSYTHLTLPTKRIV